MKDYENAKKTLREEPLANPFSKWDDAWRIQLIKHSSK
jgi:hypothetical protein